MLDPQVRHRPCAHRSQAPDLSRFPPFPFSFSAWPSVQCWKVSKVRTPARHSLYGYLTGSWVWSLIWNMYDPTPVTAVLLCHSAEFRAFTACIEAGFRELGVPTIEGVPLRQWLDKRRIVELEKVLLEIGDSNPALHDAVRACMAGALKNSRG